MKEDPKLRIIVGSILIEFELSLGCMRPYLKQGLGVVGQSVKCVACK